jgi:uncharacterized protein with PIN domain
MARDDDTLGDKLRKKEKVDEDRYYDAQDKQLIDKIRRQEMGAGGQQDALNRCPRCGGALANVSHFGVKIDECPKGHGMWMAQGELEQIASRERDSWLGRYFYRPKPIT